jgi:hypothetical protein
MIAELGAEIEDFPKSGCFALLTSHSEQKL